MGDFCTQGAICRRFMLKFKVETRHFVFLPKKAACPEEGQE
jgi:hypothetical protein